MRKPLVLAVAALAVLALILVTLALRTEYESEPLRADMVARLTQALGSPVEAGTLKLRPLEGLRLGEVRAEPRFGTGRAEIEIGAVVLESSLPSLAFGEDVEVDRVRLLQPKLRLHEPEPTPPPPKRDPPKPVEPRNKPPTPPKKAPPKPELFLDAEVDDGLAFQVQEFLIEDAELRLNRGKGGEVALLKGVDVALQGLELSGKGKSLARRASGSGEFSVKSVELEIGSFKDARGKISVDSGTMTIEELVFDTPLGEFKALFETRYTRAPLSTRVEIEADAFDLHQLVDSPDSDAFGGASFQLSAQGVGTDLNSLRGGGVVSMKEGLLPWFPLLGELEVALKRLSLYELKYEAVDARFKLADGRLDFEPFRIQSEGMWVDVDGTVSLGGELNLDLSLHADGNRVDRSGVPGHLREVLSVPGGGWSVPASVRGTAAEPLVSARVDLLVQRMAARGKAIDEAALRRDLETVFAASGS